MIVNSEDSAVNAPAATNPELRKLYGNEFGRIGVVLITRATLCAALMAVVAGSIAVLIGY